MFFQTITILGISLLVVNRQHFEFTILFSLIENPKISACTSSTTPGSNDNNRLRHFGEAILVVPK